MTGLERVRSIALRLVRRSNDAGALDHSRQRYRRVALAGVAGIAARGASTLGLIVAIALVGNELSTDALGLWILLVSAVALLGFADLGIGYGVLNFLARARARNDGDAARRAVSNAFFALLVLAVVAGGVFAAVFPHVPFERVLNLPAPLVGEGRAAIAVFVGCVLVSLPFAVSQRVHQALQEGHWAHLWSLAGTAVSLLAVVIVVAAHGSLPWLTLAMLGGLPLAYLVETIVLFGFQHRALRPRPRDVDRALGAQIIRAGLVFFLLSLFYAVAFQADTVVISHYLGPEAVAGYSIPLRLFLLAPLLTSLLVAPLWPAYGDALARGDHEWVRRTIRRSLWLTLSIVVPASVFLALTARTVLAHWVGSIEPSASLLLSMAGWAVIYGVTTTLSIFFNAAMVIRLQLATGGAMAVANIALSVVLVQSLGIEGPVIASLVTQATLGLIPMLIVLRPLLKPLDDDATEKWLRRWATPSWSGATTDARRVSRVRDRNGVDPAHGVEGLAATASGGDE